MKPFRSRAGDIGAIHGPDQVVFINHALETFTPTQSGALATIIWENCRVAARAGVLPFVVTRSSDAEQFQCDRLRAIPYPRVPSGGIGKLLCRLERRMTGWRELRHRAWAGRVASELESIGATNARLVLINEPELCIFLRRRFPNAFILHWFQNQLPCKPKMRQAFRGAADVVVGVSDFTSRWVEDYYHLTEGSVATVYNAVDAELFRPAECQPPGQPVIGFVGRTGIEKAPDLVLEAALRLSGQTRQFSVQLLGSNHWDRFELDDYQRRLSDLASRLEATGIVVYRPGHVGRSALPDMLRRAHINVMSSRWDEPFGMATLEGMACGLATAATRTGGTPEVVGDAGVLFERDDVSGLAEVLARYVGDHTYRQEMAARARNRAMFFSWERCWGQLSKLLGQSAPTT